MNPLILIGLSMLLLGGKPKPKPKKESSSTPSSATDVRELIRARARANGVPERLALAIARAESNFNPNAAGDLLWWQDAARYQRVVPKSSPYFSQRPLWHSYGLFQLLAPYHVQGPEDPRVLFDPALNAERGTRMLARLVKQYGDWDRVRLGYAGALNVSPEKQRAILDRWHSVLEKEA